MINAYRKLTIKLKTYAPSCLPGTTKTQRKSKGKICGTHLVMINANRNLKIKTHIFLFFFCFFVARQNPPTRHQLDNFCYLLILI